jgi:hypothetical protein
MAIQQPEAWKHHFVPRSLLRYFTASGDEEFLFTFDKRSRKRFRASLMNTGSQNGYNSLEVEEEVVNFESDFDDVDALLASSLRDVHVLGMNALRTPEQRAIWLDLVTVQLLRAPIVRSTMQTSMDDLAASVEPVFGKDISVPVPTKNDTRRAARGMFQERDSLRASLADKDFILFEPEGDARFRISDRPVCISNPNPYGDVGLASPGVTVFMPLGPKLLLGLLCPSARHRLNARQLGALDLEPDVASRLLALRLALSNGTSLRWSDVEVQRHNALQVARASRFVYGPSDDFEDVLGLMDANPEIGEVHSSIHVGRMGHAPAPRRAMPTGKWLVLFGQRDSYMLEVTDVTRGPLLEASVLNALALAEVMADGPFSEMQYFENQQQRQGMREVQLERTSVNPPRVRVRHSDPALSALMESIDRRRK